MSSSNLVHVSFDLETLGTDPDSLILSIGAVAFTENELLSATEYYPTIESQQTYGARASHRTLNWWLQQSAEARMALIQDERSAVSDELLALTDHLASFGPDINVWGNSANFDLAILNFHLGRNGIDTPWKFWNERCLREAKRHYPEVEVVKSEQPHEALADALAQAQTIQRILKAQRGRQA